MSTATIRAGVVAFRICTVNHPSPPTPMTTAVDPSPSSGRARRTAWCDVAPASVSGPAVRGSSGPNGSTSRIGATT